MNPSELAQSFRRLHAPGQLLLLANAWDAASARLVEACGAAAIATTSAGLAWSRGYPDGNVLPPDTLMEAVGDIARVISVPLSIDMEGGYDSDPQVVAEHVDMVLSAGAVGINIEDGTEPPELLSEKIAAIRSSSRDVFINARTDVFLSGLATPERAVAETVERARRYQAAGADGLFVPGLRDAAAIRAIAQSIDLPLNVMLVPDLPPVGELRRLGVRRVSAGASIAKAAYGVTQRLAARFLREGTYDALSETAVDYGELNALLSGR